MKPCPYRFITQIALLLFASFISVRCVRQSELIPVKFQGKAQGTYYSVAYYDKQGRNFQEQVDSLLDAFNLSLSLYERNSIISKINRNEEVTVDTLFSAVFRRSKEISAITNGSFDFTVGALVQAWGFGFTDRKKLSPNQVDSLLQFVGHDKVRLENGLVVKELDGILLDFNAIAQGYSVDVLSKYLESKGINHYLVDIGGEVFARNTKPDGSRWRVGIEKPSDATTSSRDLQLIVTIENEAIATSGNYRKYFEENGVRYSHTIDPATGYPVHHSLLSASVIAGDCMTADAYATAFMVMGVDKTIEFLINHPELDAFLIYHSPENNIATWASEGFKKRIEEKFDE